MACLGTGVGGLRTLRNMDLVRDLVFGPSGAVPPASLAAREVSPELLGLLARPEDEGIDGLGTDGA